MELTHEVASNLYDIAKADAVDNEYIRAPRRDERGRIIDPGGSLIEVTLYDKLTITPGTTTMPDRGYRYYATSELDVYKRVQEYLKMDGVPSKDVAIYLIAFGLVYEHLMVASGADVREAEQAISRGVLEHSFSDGRPFLGPLRGYEVVMSHPGSRQDTTATITAADAVANVVHGRGPIERGSGMRPLLKPKFLVDKELNTRFRFPHTGLTTTAGIGLEAAFKVLVGIKEQ